MFSNAFSSAALSSDSRKVHEGPRSFHFHNFVEVDTGRVEIFVDINVLSNVAISLPQEHGDANIEEFGHGCIIKRFLKD